MKNKTLLKLQQDNKQNKNITKQNIGVTTS